MKAAAALAAVAALALAAGASSASAAQTFGSDLTLPAATTGASCTGTCSDPSTTLLLTDVHTTNAFPESSPIDGVVVSFTAKAGGAGTLTFRLGRVAITTGLPGTTSATGPSLTFAGAGTQTVPARVPVHADDIVGYDFASSGGDVFYTSTCGNGAAGFGYNPPLVNGGAPQTSSYNSNCERLVNATVEADADHDGFGDETQDRCPGVAGPQDGCQPASTPTPTPTPTPKKKCKKKHRSLSASAAKKKCKKHHK